MDSSGTDVGLWKKLKVLGSGGFGQVTLWHNSVTGQRVAIKKLHEHTLKDPTIRGKQIERWCKEVEIMKKLNHVNIVATLEVPKELNTLTSLPVLAMEYCSHGDLRQVLNKPENCCGLREPDVLDILRDISNGLAYLHSCKIIHRDLKPDNIVLQQRDSRMVYKLIDLGYAKSLDQSSLCKSFVGTIQYIAPELFLGKAYTSSVDYWSFGLVAHEIITGYRPFLPGFGPSDWMSQIQNKARNVICVLENVNGDITFSSTISRKNHLSRCFLEDIEKWLQLALDWNGQTRGREPEKNRPVVFEELSKILCKKVINVFSLPTYETLSYEVNEDTDIQDLRLWLKEDTDLEEDDQVLLLPNGKSLNGKGSLLNSFKNEKLDRKGISLFLYNSGSIKLKNNPRTKPKFVEELIESAKKLLKQRHLKRSCADCLYFIQAEAIRYKNLLQGIRVKIDNTKQKTLAMESLYEDVGDEWSQIENFGQFLSFSHKVDLENYIYYRKIGKLKSCHLVRKWIQNVIEVDKRIIELRSSYNKSQQKQLILMARQRCRTLDNYPGGDVVQKTPLDDIVNDGYQLWENIQRMPKDEVTSNLSAVNLVSKSMDETSKLLQNQGLQSLLTKIAEADEGLVKFLSHLTALQKSTKLLKLVIENTQKERQKEVWNLIGNTKPTGDKEIESDKNKGETDEKRLSVTRELNGDKNGNVTVVPKNGNLDKKRESSSREGSCSVVSGKSEFGSNFNLENGYDTGTIIDDNNHLRYRIQDVQQTCDLMVKEIRSLNWDFME